MTDLSAPITSPAFLLRRLWQKRQNTIGALIGLAGFWYLSAATLKSEGVSAVRFRIDLRPLLEIPTVIQVHIVGAVTAFVIGAVLLAGIRGRTRHRVLGYSWVAAMSATAISSLFITSLNGDHYSFIHLLSGCTVIVLPMAIAAARSEERRGGKESR